MALRWSLGLIYDNDQCYAEYIRWYRRIHGEKRTRGAPALAPLMYPNAALLLVLAPDVQAAPLTDVLECVSILLQVVSCRVSQTYFDDPRNSCAVSCGSAGEVENVPAFSCISFGRHAADQPDLNN